MAASIPPPTSSRQEPTSRDGDTPAVPRAFVTATGYLFQKIGGVLLLIACCLWLFSGRFIKPAAQPADHWLAYLHGDRLPAAMVALSIVTLFIGGAGLAGAGVGLQGERPSSGRVAMAVTAMMALVYGVMGAVVFIKIGSVVGEVVLLGLSLGAAVLFVLAVHSASVLRMFPPPHDQNVVTEEWLEQYHRQRRHSGDRF